MTVEIVTASLVINVDDTIDDRNITIVGYPTEGHYGTNPYFTVIIFPETASYHVVADVGSVVKKEVVSYEIESEKVTFAGFSAKAEHYILSLSSIFGYFFSGAGQQVTPVITLVAGELESNIECYGTAYIRYMTKGTTYEYNAEITPNSLTVGSVFVFDTTKPGIAASFEIPLPSTEKSDPVDFCTVYSEVLLQEPSAGRDSEFEMPPNFPTDSLYPGASSAAQSSRPIVGNSYLVQKRVHEYGTFYSNGVVETHVLTANYFSPYKNASTQPDIVYKLDLKIPNSDPLNPTDVLNTSKMNDFASRMRTKYGIQ